MERVMFTTLRALEECEAQLAMLARLMRAETQEQKELEATVLHHTPSKEDCDRFAAIARAVAANAGAIDSLCKARVALSLAGGNNVPNAG